MGHFFRLCLKAAFCHRLWEKAQGIAAAIICVIGVITYMAQKLFPSFLEHEFKEWQILVFALGGIILFRLIASPYWVYEKVAYDRDKYREKLQRLHIWQQTLDEIKDGTL